MTPTVFVSEPTELSSGQRLLRGQWHHRLSELGFDVLNIGRDQHGADPWRTVLEFVEAADGVLVLGFRQLVIDSAVWRIDTNEQTAVDGVAWTSPWLQIETGMALAAGLPVLVAAESGVREGVFDATGWTNRLAGTPLEDPRWDVVDRWASTVAARAPRSLAS